MHLDRQTSSEKEAGGYRGVAMVINLHRDLAQR
jgi:hypothetical protein